VLEIMADARRGGFHLHIDCIFAAEWTIVFGPSGAGKSTLLRLLAGLVATNTQRIALDGRLLADSSRRVNLRPGRRRIAMVSQQPALFPHLSVVDNVGYGIARLSRSERGQVVEQMLALAGAENLISRRPQDLSGGEAQRVALARALATQPCLLLLDEPFSALDGAASDILLERLQRWIALHEIQVVMATHDATDALATHAEVALIRDGQLAALGPADRVLAGECERILARIGRT